MKKLLLVILAAFVALNVGVSTHAYAQSKVVRLTLIDENGSGEDGSAQLTDMGDGTTKVELIMMNAPAGAVQPAHIHKGTCTNLDPKPSYPLDDVKEGKSTTVVKVSLADLMKEKYAVNVHKSAADIAVYVSCGNLPQATAASTIPAGRKMPAPSPSRCCELRVDPAAIRNTASPRPVTSTQAISPRDGSWRSSAARKTNEKISPVTISG